MKSYSQKPADVKRLWYVIDATGISFGRVATRAAGLLLGKGKPTVTPHTDGGDFVIVINAANTQITGGKELKKQYYRHSGFPGGIYSRTLSEQAEVLPESIIQKAVYGMLPNNRLRAQRLARLKVYTGPEHNHAAQKPIELNLKGEK